MKTNLYGEGLFLEFSEDVKVRGITLGAFDPGVDIGVFVTFVGGAQTDTQALATAATDLEMELLAGDIQNTGVLNGFILLRALPTSAFTLRSLVIETVPAPSILLLLLGGLLSLTAVRRIRA